MSLYKESENSKELRVVIGRNLNKKIQNFRT